MPSLVLVSRVFREPVLVSPGGPSWASAGPGAAAAARRAGDAGNRTRCLPGSPGGAGGGRASRPSTYCGRPRRLPRPATMCRLFRASFSGPAIQGQLASCQL